MSIWWNGTRGHRSARASARLASEPAREVVDHVDRVALGQQPVDQGRTDEPGAAGDECSHVSSALRSGSTHVRRERRSPASTTAPSPTTARCRPARFDARLGPDRRAAGRRSIASTTGARRRPVAPASSDGSRPRWRRPRRPTTGADDRPQLDLGIVGRRAASASMPLAAHGRGARRAGRAGPAGSVGGRAGVDPVGLGLHGVQRPARRPSPGRSRARSTTLRPVGDAVEHRRLEHVGAGVDPVGRRRSRGRASRRTSMTRPSSSMGTTP